MVKLETSRTVDNTVASFVNAETENPSRVLDPHLASKGFIYI